MLIAGSAFHQGTYMFLRYKRSGRALLHTNKSVALSLLHSIPVFTAVLAGRYMVDGHSI